MIQMKEFIAFANKNKGDSMKRYKFIVSQSLSTGLSTLKFFDGDELLVTYSSYALEMINDNIEVLKMFYGVGSDFEETHILELY